MFAKSFRIKSSSKLKGSERKKLILTLKYQFPALSEEDVDLLFPRKENAIFIFKIRTHNDELVLLYCQNSEPLFFTRNDHTNNVNAVSFYPTLYTLWRFPECITAWLTTSPSVETNLANGADLMAAGIVYKHGSYQPGDIVAVNTTLNASAISVGFALMYFDDDSRVGKCLKSLHVKGDYLWQFGSKVDIPIKPFKTNDDAAPFTSDKIEFSTSNNVTEQNLKDQSSYLEVPLEPLCTMSLKNDVVSQMDSLLKKTFLQALQSTEVPILTSKFFRIHMVQACPPNEGPLDLKKSSYKKLNIFLEKMQQKGFVVVKQVQTGVDEITKIHGKNLSVPFLKSKNDTAASLEVEERFIVTAPVIPFFKTALHGASLTRADVRECLRVYVKTEQLVTVGSSGQIRLDPLLAGIVLGKGDNGIEEMGWEQLSARILSKMTSAFLINGVLHKGKLDLIELEVVVRSGNKKVTLIHNLEVYGIDARQFAQKCRIGVATSTSVVELPENKNKKSSFGPRYQVFIQGNQINFVVKLLLEEYKIAKKFLKGIEKAPKQKKK